MAEEPRLDNVPLIRDAIRSWYRSLADSDLTDWTGHLEALGVILILLARLAPSSTPALTETESEVRHRLAEWKEALGELLRADLEDGSRR